MHRLIIALGALLALAACQNDAPDYDPAHDYFSYANTGAFITEHLALDLDVDFTARSLHGTATLHMRNLHPHERTIVLDGRDLTIEGARVGRNDAGWAEAAFEVGPTDAGLGEPIRVTLPEGFDPQGGFELELRYRTSPGASALQWLPAELTTSGEPLLFSQSQSIHARSWVPLQDTPAVRITYEAVLRTPQGMRALMSADNDPQAAMDGEFHFQMPQPIPSYLLAIAVGRLDFAALGPETGVYAEPGTLAAAAHEFADTQAMLDLAETQYGPYDWGRYDLLVLPPSFPYGGMENPRLSFITPSLLAGDRSLVAVIAHELAHSWSGNLVTNATWRDIWLNEGTTSYLEARLMEDLYGKERADEERVLAYATLQSDLATVPERFQPLAPELRLADGPDAQDGLQYAKGQFFLEHLERQFGREAFDPVLRDWFATYRWRSVTTEQFLDHIDAQLLSTHPGIYTREQAGEWLYQPGLPADFQPPHSDNLERAAAAARDLAAGEVAATALAERDWSPQAAVYFINSLPAEVDAATLGEVDAAFAFSQSQNAEIGQAWFTQVALRRFEPAYPRMEAFLLRHGRIKLVSPVYKALAGNGSDQELAQRIFADARAGYHPLTVSAIERVLAGTAGAQ